ncbi:unnamed protein product [Vitrella brassicaformis CCMP3155]|uniref:Uncharacterized protein n=1 Tax=Vitrella brassicaformis (strain CCMP3155) TaxID=1169540 RepID=A0A0G4G317_VITBC|nr:unnamed protein product [Vitrella brassicaformis CCMP3155]|mmetsp:Transcript_43233/g.108018  ORF Transcript_43233/g.108018 Transcript_43233/m.108018 type:complete len:512 (-) Transcript_43233:216-1751(-)|eukprot:CEM22490.1 unnamed protein product [Vitrella brassicaformis CCMP3155]
MDISSTGDGTNGWPGRLVAEDPDEEPDGRPPDPEILAQRERDQRAASILPFPPGQEHQQAAFEALIKAGPPTRRGHGGAPVADKIIFAPLPSSLKGHPFIRGAKLASPFNDPPDLPPLPPSFFHHLLQGVHPDHRASLLHQLKTELASPATRQAQSDRHVRRQLAPLAEFLVQCVGISSPSLPVLTAVHTMVVSALSQYESYFFFGATGKEKTEVWDPELNARRWRTDRDMRQIHVQRELVLPAIERLEASWHPPLCDWGRLLREARSDNQIVVQYNAKMVGPADTFHKLQASVPQLSELGDKLSCTYSGMSRWFPQSADDGDGDGDLDCKQLVCPPIEAFVGSKSGHMRQVLDFLGVANQTPAPPHLLSLGCSLKCFAFAVCKVELSFGYVGHFPADGTDKEKRQALMPAMRAERDAVREHMELNDSLNIIPGGFRKHETPFCLLMEPGFRYNTDEVRLLLADPANRDCLLDRVYSWADRNFPTGNIPESYRFKSCMEIGWCMGHEIPTL